MTDDMALMRWLRRAIVSLALAVALARRAVDNHVNMLWTTALVSTQLKI